MNRTTIRWTATICVLAGTATGVSAQDSVAVVPGNSDALSPYGAQTVRYAIDLVPFNSSWNKSYAIGPVMKASADNDPLFPTQLLGSVALSPDQLSNLVFGATQFAAWTNAPGTGVHPTQNFFPPTVGVSQFDRQFGLGLSDLASNATNVVGATIGQNASNLLRLYVTRTVASSSRATAGGSDTATLSMGGIDASGNISFRADSFNTTAGTKVLGENILRVDLPTRSAVVNTLTASGGSNIAANAAATAFVINNGPVTTNTPASLPEAGANPPLSVILDFANTYRNNGAAGVTAHLSAGIESHRGNPSFSGVAALGGVGVGASLARSTPGAGKVDSLNVFALSATGGIVATQSATLPVPINDGAGFTANSAGDAEFLQYLSQESFRGGNGQAAVGSDPLTGTTLVAATANEPASGDFIAVARLSGGSPAWTVAAHIGKNVLNGPAGSSIGTLAAGSPASISAPGIDSLGNVYFVARFLPTAGPLTTGLFKAVNTASGYQIELLVKAGDSFVGANSGRTYTIQRLTLGDSDSLASGTFHSANVLRPQAPGQSTADSASSFAAGGLIVNALLQYNNGGTPEQYESVMFISGHPPTVPVCAGDDNEDGTVNFEDLNRVLGNFGVTGAPGSPGDENEDGTVNFEDLNRILGNFGQTC